jgi:outer membrane immunogenic protein
LISAAVFAAAVASAVAADLPVRTYTKAPALAAPYDWSGFYIGANAGYGSSRLNWFFTNDLVTPGPAADEGPHRATGALAGGQIGYNWQMASWVVGIEAQGDWAGLSGSNVSAFFAPIVNRTRIDAIGLFTGKLGYAWSNSLLYVKGGAAVSRNRYDFFVTSTGTASPESRWGGVVGAGFEYGLTPNWSLGVEYNHAFLGSRNIAFVQSNPFSLPFDDISQNLDMVTLRVNYRFGGPIVARY